MKSFHSKPYPENDEIHQLAQSLSLKKGRIKKWYKRRRYLSRRVGLTFNGEECRANIKSVTILLRIVCTYYFHRKFGNNIMHVPITDSCSPFYMYMYR